MAGKYSVEAIFRGQDRLSRPIARMEGRVERFSRSATRGLRRVDAAADRIGRGLKKVAVGAAVAAAGVGIVGKDVVETGAAFEQSLTNAAAKFPGEVKRGTEAFAKLEAAAAKVGGTTEFTAANAAEGLNFLAMAGFDAEQAIAALPGVVDLATAAQVELGQASDIATDSLGAFALATKDPIQLGKNLARVNDVLAKTTTTSNTNLEQMFEAIKDGGPVATAAGASVEQFAALVGTLANAGIKGTQAGNVIKNVFLRLQAPASAGRKALASLGIKTKDAAGNFRGVLPVLGDLKKKLAGLGTATQAAKLDAIFGKRAIAGAQVLLNEGVDKLAKYQGALEGATGANSKMAAQIRDTTTGDLKSFESAVESVKIAVFGVARGPLREVVQGITGWTRENRALIATRFEGWLSDIRGNLPEIWTWTKRIGIGIGVFLGISAAVKVARVVLFAWTVATKAAALAHAGLVLALGLEEGATWRQIAATTASAVRTGASTAATWLKVGATQASALATTQFSLATIRANIVTAIATARTWLATAARTAWNVVTLLATGRLSALTAGTVASTAATTVATARTWLSTAALGAKNAVLAVAPGLFGSYAAATGTASTATAGFMATLGPLVLAIGAVTAAVFAWREAFAQAEELKKRSGGLGITGIVGEMWKQGTWDPVKAVDTYQNEVAKRDKALGMKATGGAAPERAIGDLGIGAGAGGIPGYPTTGTAPGAPMAPGQVPGDGGELARAMAQLTKVMQEQGGAEVTIRDETGRASVKGKGARLAPGSKQSGTP